MLGVMCMFDLTKDEKEKTLMNIGIFGGTFNPPHIGHLIAAEHVRTELSLDRIIFVPAALPPHKLNQDVTAPEHRLAMVRLAIQDNAHFDLSEIEITRGGVSFTIDTLRELKAKHPDDQLFLLIGMDNLVDFHTWKSPERIVGLARVVVMTRPGFTTKDVPSLMKEEIRMCPVPEIGIASRELRKRVSEGKSIQYLVAESVRCYIEEHRLYRTEER